MMATMCDEYPALPLKLEMNKNPPEVFVVLLDAVLKLFDVPLMRNRKTFFLSSPLPLPRMISTRLIFFSSASSTMRLSSEVIWSPRL
jgi:hypothetical protein